MEGVNKVLVNPRYHTALSLVKSFRNGAMYGLKIRFPHALVMTFLFQEGSLRSKVEFILRATFQHGRNLALLVTSYKVLGLILRKIMGRKHPIQNFICAAISGYFVFGESNKINMQINMYLLSRITVGLARLALEKKLIPQPKLPVFPWFAALMWGTLLYLFEYHRHTLQPSLQNSMTYIFSDSAVWSNVWDFIVYNSATLW